MARQLPLKTIRVWRSEQNHMNNDNQTPVHAAVMDCVSHYRDAEASDSGLTEIVEQRCALRCVEQATCIVEMTVRHLLETIKRSNARRAHFQDSTAAGRI
jgi:hypothetical protein